MHPRCALDERGNGVYGDTINNYLRTSDQQSHEIALISNNEGRLNYTFGATPIYPETSRTCTAAPTMAWRPAAPT